MTYNTTCESLNLTCCSIDDLIIDIMFNYIYKKTNLHTLILNENNIQNKSMAIMSKVILLGYFHPIVLKLSMNKINSWGLDLLIGAFRNAP